MSNEILRITDRYSTLVNESFEGGIGAWVTAGTNTLEISTEQARFGSQSLKITVQDNILFAALDVTLSSADPHVFSAWVYLPSTYDGLVPQMRFGGTNGKPYAHLDMYVAGPQPAIFIDTAITDAWQHVWITIIPDPADLIASVRFNQDTIPTAGEAIYVDGVRVEKRPDFTSFRPDSDTTTISLLSGGRPGLNLDSVRPQVSRYKDGGVFLSSPFSGGRRLVDFQFENVIETFSLKVLGLTHDELSRKMQDIRRLLIKASQYWTTEWQNVPVWIEARSSQETNSRYAIIHAGTIPDDENMWAGPFLQQGASAVMDNINLIIERGHWLSEPPDTSRAIELSATEKFALSPTPLDEFVPEADADDATINDFGSTIALTGDLRFGFDGANDEYSLCCRFIGVDIPQSIGIVSAKIVMQAAATDSGSFDVDITGELGDAATYSTYANVLARSYAVADVNWSPPDFTNNVEYETPDLTTIVQEIVDDVGWTSGNDMAFVFFLGSGSSERVVDSFDTAPSTAPRLVVELEDGGFKTYGNVDSSGAREPQIGREVYAANKRNTANITHVFVDDGGTFGVNLVGATTPYSLLPAVPATSDAVYFGIATSLVNSGPFSSLVFDIGTPAVYTGAAVLNWEYWDGAWDDLAESSMYDNTDDGDGPFTFSHVNALTWTIPFTSATDWETTTVNGVTGYWIRAEVQLGGGTISQVPTQQNRDIYTVVWPYVEVQSDQVGGDMEALLRMVQLPTADDEVLVAPSGIIMGSRSLARGPNFTSHLNLSDEQNPEGVTVSATEASFTSIIDSPTGRALARTFAVPGDDGVERKFGVVTISSALARDYVGRYRLFMRLLYYEGVTNDFDIKITVFNRDSDFLPHIFEATRTISAPLGPTQKHRWMLLDFGILEIPYLPTGGMDTLVITFDVTGTEVGGLDSRTLALHDLIFIPVDEVAIEARADQKWFAISTDLLTNDGPSSHAADGTYSKESVSFLRKVPTDIWLQNWQLRASPGVTMTERTRSRIYFLGTVVPGVATVEYFSNPTMLFRPFAQVSNQYLSMRGDR